MERYYQCQINYLQLRKINLILPKILLTTYHEAFLYQGGSEKEIKNIEKILKKDGYIADIYGSNSLNIAEYDIVLHFSVENGGLKLLREIKQLSKTIILFPNLYNKNEIASEKIVNEFVELANLVIFTSKSMQKHFEKYYTIPSYKVKIIDYLFERNSNSDLLKGMFKKIFELDDYALTYGIIDSNKNQMSAIKALKKLNLKHIIIGKYREANYYEECKKLGVNNTIFIDSLPVLSDIATSAFVDSKLYIELSEEPASISAIEAGLNGCNLILANTEWSREIFGNYATYVNIKCFDSIVEGIKEALSKNVEIIGLKERLSKYNIENSLFKLKELLQDESSLNKKVSPKVLLVQRGSMSHDSLLSRSTSARFIPLLTYMQSQNLISWNQIHVEQIKAEDISQHDILILNKHLSDKAVKIVNYAKVFNKKVIYDLDDDIFNIPSYSVTSLDDKELNNAKYLLKKADSVLVSSPALKNNLNKINIESVLLLNAFDHERFNVNLKKIIEVKSKKILFSNTDKLKIIKFKDDFIILLNDFISKYPDIEIDFWGDEFDGLDSIKKVNKKGFLENYSYKKEIYENNYLFAIIPLGGEEDKETYDFNKCKSHIKFIDYSSLCIPGIYSNNPVYSDIIENNKTGIIVNNEYNEWFAAMEKLYLDEEFRENIKKNAFEFSLNNFGLKRKATTLMNIIYKL